ncbi:hypothetical protein [Amycolatopsis mediterranei]|uniref:Uncharacterized protein n=1 Tax=Amycolatopsis mediterranei (strain S699) TaxID=713604 RepID=A0A9R0NX16_AMYMS|nr:hypothetical protein [Amycolatopsis mediterranei]AEK42169.1 hypothetical protein RAM_18415 [Amycolatopsis mediterranei S699]KDO05983.1 hypothetical protein DV26_35430 [Amycolatopsis mediterranei]KDU88876.1 hypothetical protein DV36_28450 [Amycolatopsis mediterranei]UZF70613.1 hypothetical protein ISP_003835 [Amycolatopsis mediterranei]
MASERIFNVQSALRSGNRPFVGATVVTYGGITSVIAGYTVVIVVQTFGYLHKWGILIAVAYFLLLGLVTLSWRAGLRIVGDVDA